MARRRRVNPGPRGSPPTHAHALGVRGRDHTGAGRSAGLPGTSVSPTTTLPSPSVVLDGRPPVHSALAVPGAAAAHSPSVGAWGSTANAAIANGQHHSGKNGPTFQKWRKLSSRLRPRGLMGGVTSDHALCGGCGCFRHFGRGQTSLPGLRV